MSGQIPSEVNTLLSHPLMETLKQKYIYPKGGRIVKFGTHTDYSSVELSAYKDPKNTYSILSLDKDIADLFIKIESERCKIYKLQQTQDYNRIHKIRDGNNYRQLIKEKRSLLIALRSKRKILQKRLERLVTDSKL